MVVSDSGGETLLHYAAFHGQDKILEWLLERVRTMDDTSDVGGWWEAGTVSGGLRPRGHGSGSVVLPKAYMAKVFGST